MVIAQKYNIIDPDRGFLDRRVFTDEEMYQDELEKIFGRAWLMVSHESLIPNANDFFLSYIGEDPVIVTRDAKGKFHIFLNMCRHRGNRVVRADDGNAKNFMCTYHGWTFSNEGKLVSVPGLQEAYYGELDVENLGLVEARCDTYAGIIFGCWAEDAPSLEAYLGDARYYLDVKYNRRDIGQQAIGPVKWPLPVNWKTPVDNASDNYHAPLTHFSAVSAAAQRRGDRRPSAALLSDRFDSPSRHLYLNGHSLTLRIVEEKGAGFHQVSTGGDEQAIEKFRRDTLPEVERRLGEFRARKLQLGNHSFFPNTFLGLRFALPRGPMKSEAWSFVLYDKDAPEAVILANRLLMEQKDNPSGIFEQDDTDNWRQMTDSGRLMMGRKYASNLTMGIGHEGPSKDFKGVVADQFISESNQRHYYARWQEMMNANSWADIKIDPITIEFEGTATLRG